MNLKVNPIFFFIVTVNYSIHLFAYLPSTVAPSVICHWSHHGIIKLQMVTLIQILLVESFVMISSLVKIRSFMPAVPFKVFSLGQVSSVGRSVWALAYIQCTRYLTCYRPKLNLKN